MKTLNRTYANKRVHSQLKGKNSTLIANGEFGRVELKLIAGKYRVIAVNKQTKQHFVKSYATVQGALVAFDNLKEYWV